VIFNHGSTGNGDDPSQFRITYTNEPIARFFTTRGWMIAFPQRRGRGQSDGVYDEGFTPDRTRYSCLQAPALAGVERALQDVDAAVDLVRARPDVDRARLLAAGVSRGGILAAAHAARRPGVYRGVVNFVGGWLGEGCADAVAVNRPLFAAAGTFAGRTIWLYGENDPFYSVAHSRANFDAFVAAGGSAGFHVYTRAPGLNGHFIINDPGLWTPDLDAYVNAI
jgi:dienelactone hydrolase